MLCVPGELNGVSALADKPGDILKQENRLRQAIIESCNIVGNWYLKNGYKYKKYKEAIYFIKENDYQRDFLK
jgi:hypothetical protein